MLSALIHYYYPSYNTKKQYKTYNESFLPLLSYYLEHDKIITNNHLGGFMRNKIVLSSVSFLSALIVAACGNGEKST